MEGQAMDTVEAEVSEEVLAEVVDGDMPGLADFWDILILIHTSHIRHYPKLRKWMFWQIR